MLCYFDTQTDSFMMSLAEMWLPMEQIDDTEDPDLNLDMVQDDIVCGVPSFYDPCLYLDTRISPDQKLQIRHDCMWAGHCGDQSHPEKSNCCCGHKLVQQQQQQQQQQPQQAQLPTPAAFVQQPSIGTGIKSEPEPLKAIKTESTVAPSRGILTNAVPVTGVNSSSLVSRTPIAITNASVGTKSVGIITNTTSLLTPFKATQSSAQIKAGSSILKRHQQHQQHSNESVGEPDCAPLHQQHLQHPEQKILRIPHLPRGSFLAKREQDVLSIAAQNHARPDTPLSLDDDPLEFKHPHIDLMATCTIGSNQQRLLQPTAPATGGAMFSSPVSTSGVSSGGNSPTMTASSSSGPLSGVESRPIAPSDRLSNCCNCGGSGGGGGGGGGGGNSSRSGGHTTLCYLNYLQDSSSTDMELRIKKLREQLLMIDGSDHLQLLHHNTYHQAQQHFDRSCSPISPLAQLLDDLQEIENSSNTRSSLFDDQHLSGSGAGGKGASGDSAALGLLQQQHASQQHGPHQSHQQQCGWNSLDLMGQLSPVDERKRRFQAHHHMQRANRDLIRLSDDEDDGTEYAVKQLEEDDDFTTVRLDLDDEEEDYDVEDDEDDDEEEEEYDQDDDEEEEEEDEEEEEEEEEDDVDNSPEEEDETYTIAGGRGRSRNRATRNNHYQHRRSMTASRCSYRSRDVMKKQKKQANGDVLPVPVNGGIECKSSSSVKMSAGGQQQQQQQPGNTGAGQLPAQDGVGSSYFGDHSYTRPKGGYNMNELGVQTPSDSDEEIDVVSLGEKNLPTNPTARDCRQLQSEVASKIRTASTRGASSLTQHHHPHYQRQHQQHLGDGQSSGGGIYPTPAGSTTISGANTPLPTGSGCGSAAASPPPTTCSGSPSSGGTHASSNRKRSGGKRSGAGMFKRMRLSSSKRHAAATGAGSSGSDDPAAQAIADELDTAEKRNLHNNLERQRRIGLKNLFEELKRQIPQLRDKDRAPKVHILREAAELCRRLNREAEQVNELRQRQVKLYERVRYLRSTMHSQRQGHE
ncbi:uncharacterized protein LOC128728947 [Anopheles nili]|uniref:uncharacterized protein LOC128728947 n=1 Tax=Anopheles nili TaxID=185578 RepID=UPI00237AEF54|nr:uncharacterized protein LOC128728947 [Anopheles nili]